MISWAAFRLIDGTAICSLPTLFADYPLTRTLGAYDTATAHLVIDGTQPAEWQDATTPGYALLGCYDDDDPNQPIIWAGFVTSRTRLGETNQVDLGLVTAEGYFDRRYVNDDLTYTNVGQLSIVSDLVFRYATSNPKSAFNGLVNLATITTTSDTTLISQQYNAADVGTLYEALQALSGLSAGPEWKIEWVWNGGVGVIYPMLYTGNRVGSSASPATFQMPGSLVSAEITEDYTNEKGATKVRAYTSAGGMNPSAYITGATDGLHLRPPFEFSFEPPNVKKSSQLTSAATRAAARMADGTLSIKLVADRLTAPRFMTDWSIGDDIAYVIGGTDPVTGADIIPTVPGGLTGTLRAIGVEISDDTIAPVVAEVDPTT